ncbi:Lhy protein, partial [Globisporangium splendens]
MKISNHHDGSSSLRELDDLLMGGNDLDAIPFEFGCDYFGSAFEDKLWDRHSAFPVGVPALSVDESPLKHAIAVVSRAQQTTTRSHQIDSKQEHEWSRLLPSPPTQEDLEDHERQGTKRCGGTLPASSATSTHIGRWTKKEHELFLEGLKLYGKSWKKISSLVITRTLVQIRTHAQKYLQKQSKNAQKAAAAAAASNSSSSASTNSSKARQRCGAQKHNGEHPDAWKGQRGLVPISFPDILLASSSPSSSSSTCTPSSSSSAYSRSSSPYTLPTIAKKESSNFSNNVCRLDQLLQDESHGNVMEGYYQSPIGSDDEILHPMYVGAGHWSRDDTHSAIVAPSCSSVPSASLSSSNSQQFPNKRRRLEHLMPASSSSQLVNPMEAVATSSEAQVGMFGLEALHHGTSCFGTADFHHQPNHHSYNPTTQFVDSECIYNNWQLP